MVHGKVLWELYGQYGHGLVCLIWLVSWNSAAGRFHSRLSVYREEVWGLTGRITCKWGFKIEFSLETPIRFKIHVGEDWEKKQLRNKSWLWEPLSFPDSPSAIKHHCKAGRGSPRLMTPSLSKSCLYKWSYAKNVAVIISWPFIWNRALLQW